MDSSGNIYVADANNARIQVFASMSARGDVNGNGAIDVGDGLLILQNICEFICI